jgi:LPXTG-motif cell wall-anchored protein
LLSVMGVDALESGINLGMGLVSALGGLGFVGWRRKQAEAA